MAWHVTAIGKSLKVEEKILADMAALKLEGIEGGILNDAMVSVVRAISHFKDEDAVRLTASGNVTEQNGVHLSIIVEPVHGFVE